MQFEANPTGGAGNRERSVTLRDGDRELTRVPGEITVLF